MQRKLALAPATLALAALLPPRRLPPRRLPAREPVEGASLSLSLLRSGSDDDLRGRADVRSQNRRSRSRLRLRHGPAGRGLELYGGGLVRDAIATSRTSSVHVAFAMPPSGKARWLDFDAPGKWIQVLQTASSSSRATSSPARRASVFAPGRDHHRPDQSRP